MPVLTMHEANWDDPRELSNGQEMQALRQNMGSVRAPQDEARVGYMLQRPDSQTGKVAQPPYASKAWPARERTALEQVDNRHLCRSGCLIHKGTYLTLSLTLTITLTLLNLTVTVRVTLTLPTLLTLILYTVVNKAPTSAH